MCPWCDGKWSEYIGCMGSVHYYRCHCCGMDFTDEDMTEDDDECQE